jgi:hypothetical protein
VERALKFLDFREVRFQEIWVVVFALEVVCEFGEVEDLDVVFCFGDEGAARAPPAIVVCFCVVDFVLFFL